MSGTPFAEGRNAPLAATRIRFEATASTPLDLCALVVGEDLRVASDADVVFFNQPATAGVRLDGGAIEIDLDALRPGAHAVLCVVAADGDGIPAGLRTTVTLGPDGVGVLEPADPRAASICWELYRRGDGWKVRAVGQGYDGGLAQLLPAHGVVLEDEPAAPTAAPPRAPASSPGPASPPTSSLPWQSPDPSQVPVQSEHAFERMLSIFEDAARSTAAYDSAAAYAAERLQQELSDVLADPAARVGGAGDAARAGAQRRHDDLVAEARARLDGDHALLEAELRAIDPQLPAPLATWDSPAWRRTAESGDAVRVGDLLSGRSALQVPMCVRLPLARPVWLGAPARIIAPAALSLTLRLLAADRRTRVELLDPTGELGPVAEACDPLLAAPPARTAAEVAERVRALHETIDRVSMSREAGVPAEPEPRVVLLGDPGDDWDEQVVADVVRLVQHGPAHGVSVVVTGELDAAPTSRALRVLDDVAMHLPVAGQATITDPWVGTEWDFAIDLAPFDPADRTRIVEGLAAP